MFALGGTANFWSLSECQSSRTNGPRGFPREILGDDVDSKYLCGYCKLILKRPHQSECGHRFCKGCVEYHVSREASGEVSCPQCAEEEEEEEGTDAGKLRRQMFPDNALNRDLQKIEVKCINPSCGWTGKFSGYEKHVSQCGNKPVLCLCGKEFVRDGFDDHERTDCLLRKELCQFCAQPIIVREMEAHWERCASKPSHLQGSLSGNTLCPFGCSVSLSSLDQQLKHYEEQHVKHTSHVLRMIQMLQFHCYAPASSSLQHQQPQISQRSPKDSGIATEPRGSDLMMLQGSLKVLEDTVFVIADVVNRDDENIKSLNQQLTQSKELLDCATVKIKSLERTLTLKDIQLAELDLRVQYLENTNYKGTLLWRVNEFSRRRQEAASGKTTSVYSPVFHTSRTGYKMCGRLYINGDGIGKGSHVSLFFVLLRGTYDALIPWPFRQKVTFKFINQNNRDHMIDAFRPDPTSTSFQRPKSEMNIASGCPLFMPHSQLDDPRQGFIVDNTAFIQIAVELSGLDDY